MGRHREFDPDTALDAALELFWQKGFEGTSFADLCEKTGVARPGLYAAFGNKEEFFLKALDRYAEKYMCFMDEALDEPTARAVAERTLRGAADAQTAVPGAQGCLGVNGALACSDSSEAIRQELVRRRSASEAALATRLARARADGDLPKDCDPDALARHTMTVSQGMAVQAKAGAKREQLHEVVDLFMAAWPSS